MFLTGSTLSDAVRSVLGGRNIRCAVAFWGQGAAEQMQKAGANVGDASILCDISMGGCWPGALEELGAPKNPRLRRYDGLHAKVYISTKGMVVGSPNATANGIGFGKREPVWLEAGTFHEPDSQAWQQAVAWFKLLYRNADMVDDAALDEARRRWRPTPGSSKFSVREGSLLDLVRADPDRFGTIGFVFTNVRATEEDREVARQNLIANEGVRAAEVNALPASGIFTNWEDANLRRWPASFIEFWLSQQGNLSVYGRRVRFFERESGSVFTVRDWRTIRHELPVNAPTADRIGEADASIAATLLTEAGGGLLFPSARYLSQALIGLQFG